MLSGHLNIFFSFVIVTENIVLISVVKKMGFVVIVVTAAGFLGCPLLNSILRIQIGMMHSTLKELSTLFLLGSQK